MMFRPILCLAAAVAITAPACSNAAPRSTEPAAAVAIKDFAFAPRAVEVDAGSTVEWTNRDSVLHTVTSGDTSGRENKADGVFAGRLDATGATFSHTFDQPGTYSYFCAQHNVMNAMVQVEDGGKT